MSTSTIWARTRALASSEADLLDLAPSGDGYSGSPAGKWRVVFLTPDTGVYIGGQNMPAGSSFGTDIPGYELPANEAFTVVLSQDPDATANTPILFMTTTQSAGASIAYVVTVEVS